MTDVTIPDATKEEVTVVTAGLASVQMQAIGFGDFDKVNAAGSVLRTLAMENYEAVRSANRRPLPGNEDHRTHRPLRVA